MIRLHIKDIATRNNISFEALQSSAGLQEDTLRQYWQDETQVIQQTDMHAIACALKVETSTLFDDSEEYARMSDKFLAEEGDIAWL